MNFIPSQPDAAPLRMPGQVASCQTSTSSVESLPVARALVPASPRPDSTELVAGRVAASPLRNGGFTLVEVMISIAIALVLILGIAQIFSMAQRTTGAGTQVLAATDATRGIQQTLLNDARGITNTIGDSPALVIFSFPQAVFRNKVDQQEDLDGKPTTLNDPVNGGQSLAAESISTIDDRIHRTDALGFFARGSFTRRTGDSGNTAPSYPASLTSPTTSEEAFIWYGHLALPDNDAIAHWQWNNPSTPTPPGQFWNPGSGDPKLNPNNFFASDWILGREVILLAPRLGSGEPHILGTSTGNNPLWLSTSTSSSGNLTESQSYAVDGSVNIPLHSSRYDLADGSIASYRQVFPPPQPAVTFAWWPGWEGLSGWDIKWAPTPPAYSPPPPTPTQVQQTRFFADPFARKPASGAVGSAATQQLSAAIAQMSPIFVRGCSQFIVEFAGDYLTQDANGQIVAGKPDGQIDYVDIVDPVTKRHTHQIRWYGFPRNTAATANGPTPFDGGVLPLSELLNLVNKPAVGHTLDFERSPLPKAGGGVPPPGPWNGTWATNAVTTNGLPALYPQATGGSPTPYLCAWGPDTDGFGVPRPKMLRITVGIDDPTGHLNTQQIYEYVINLP